MKNIIVIIAFLMISTSASSAVEMQLEKIDGGFDKLSQYRGKWVVVNYWATWCPPCVEEMPDLQNFHDDHKLKDAVVIGINSEDVSTEKLKTFLEDNFISYPIYVSEPSYKSALGTLPGMPTTFVLSPAGNVEAKQVGMVTKEMIENFINNWEAGK